MLWTSYYPTHTHCVDRHRSKPKKNASILTAISSKYFPNYVNLAPNLEPPNLGWSTGVRKETCRNLNDAASLSLKQRKTTSLHSMPILKCFPRDPFRTKYAESEGRETCAEHVESSSSAWMEWTRIFLHSLELLYILTFKLIQNNTTTVWLKHLYPVLVKSVVNDDIRQSLSYHRITWRKNKNQAERQRVSDCTTRYCTRDDNRFFF